MKQSGTVVKILDIGMAKVVVSRGTACGGNCSSCGGSCSGGCQENPDPVIKAYNPVRAGAGSRVTVESGTGTVMKAAVLAYILPMAVMVCAFAVAYSMGLSEGLCVAVSFAALVLTAAVLVVTDRRRKKITYTITAV